MKSVFRFSVIAVLTLAFAAVSFAQNPCEDVDAKTAKYKEFTDNYPKKDVAGLEVALAAAKSYVEKWGACAEDKEQVDYFNKYIPDAQKRIDTMKGAAKTADLYKRFNTAVKTKNWDDVYASGKEVLAQEKDAKTKLDVTILLGSIGFDEAVKGNDKYNADTIKYAQEAIKMIEGGATSDSYGVGVEGSGITYKNAKFPDTKSNALGWLNYNIGYIKYYREPKDKAGAIPYFYKVSQTNSAPKSLPILYTAIGQSYLDKLVPIDAERTKLIEDAKKETDQAKAKELTDKATELYAMQKGYADRVTDAFARAYNLLTDPKDKALKDEVYKNLKDIYTFRYNGKADGLDSYVASVKGKPMPDPSSQVTPVVEAPVEPATTTGTTTPAATTNTAKPAATTTPAKPSASTTTTTTVKSTTTTTAETPAKKPAPKKKGTR